MIRKNALAFCCSAALFAGMASTPLLVNTARADEHRWIETRAALDELRDARKHLDKDEFHEAHDNLDSAKAHLNKEDGPHRDEALNRVKDAIDQVDHAHKDKAVEQLDKAISELEDQIK